MPALQSSPPTNPARRASQSQLSVRQLLCYAHHRFRIALAKERTLFLAARAARVVPKMVNGTQIVAEQVMAFQALALAEFGLIGVTPNDGPVPDAARHARLVARRLPQRFRPMQALCDDHVRPRRTVARNRPRQLVGRSRSLRLDILRPPRIQALAAQARRQPATDCRTLAAGAAGRHTISSTRIKTSSATRYSKRGIT